MAVINSETVKKLFLSGAHALNEQKEYINELNVFPVPDGDTGTNMTMTVISSVKDVLDADETNMESVCRAISSGALRGARGNSGVILSQLFRGFMRVIREKESIHRADIAEAMVKATDSAYRAVMKPKEGTILTVARSMSEKAAELAHEDMDQEAYFRAILEAGEDTLQKTPEMLPVLKQAGVVDSGGQGLMVFLHGVFDAFLGKTVNMTLPVMTQSHTEAKTVDTSNLDTSDIHFIYCTEFIIKSDHVFDESVQWELRDYLEKIGDSIVCVADENIVKIHVHTNEPGNAIQKALTYGELSRLKIDNMKEEHEERLFKDAERLAKEQKEKQQKKVAYDPETAKEIGFVAVSSGEGLTDLFTQLGTDHVIHGGQTMNPSTEDFISAINQVNAKHLLLFPNNPNVILAADQAAKMVKDRTVSVIPTRSVPEGISCMVNYLPESTPEENIEAMNEVRKAVRTIEITYSVRDTVINGTALKKGDYMALSQKEILSSGTDLEECVREALDKAITDETTVVSIYYGEDVAEEDADVLGDEISSRHLDTEVEVTYGGQPVYYYLISVE